MSIFQKGLPSIPIVAWVAASIVLGYLTAVLLRENNFRMGELRDQVYSLDQAGDEVGARTAVELLDEFSSSHMNAAVGGEIHLAASYAAAVEEAQSIFYAQDVVTSSLYDQAQEECEDPNIILSLRAECVQQYVTARTATSATVSTEIDLPDAKEYKFSFRSPVWTPDLAGFFLITTVVAAGWAAVRIVIKAVYS